MTKYKLLKPIPNCDWKVGELVELTEYGAVYLYDEVHVSIFPHEIALLIHCGFLEEVREETPHEYIAGLDESTSKIVFTDGKLNSTEEVLRLSKEGFFYRGEKVEDINNIYERFTEWMNIAEQSKNTQQNPEIHRFTEMPPEGTRYWFMSSDNFCDIDQVARGTSGTPFDVDVFRFKSGNMFKDRESAEKAYKLILEKE